MAGVYNSPTSVDLPNLANPSYIDRVNRAVDFVTAHLGERIRLEDVADAACFSPFHFHRVFRMLMGETLGAFIKRVRLERAVFLLSHQPGATLTEIALDCGFSSSSDFSRSFRARYGVAPRRFDLESFRRSGAEALRAKLPPADPAGSSDQFVANVRRQPARHVAYVRVYRPYQADNAPQAIARLLAWAEQRGLFEAWNGRPFAHGTEFFSLRAQLPVDYDPS